LRGAWWRLHHPSVASAQATTATAPPDLLEREAAQTMLLDALSAARGGEGRLVFVSGDAGIGKSALVRAFCAEAPDARVLSGSCDGLRTPRPLGPFLDIADACGGALADTVAGGGSAQAVFEALVEELRSSRGETIALVEDVHWADEATLDVVRLLCRRAEQLGALVLVTYRTDELARTHSLRVVVGDLVTAPGVLRVDLQPLSREAVAELAAPHGVDPSELHDRTAGNPFFVTEVLATGSAQVPATVRDAVLARVARLGDAARGVLDAVAVVPPRTELWLLGALAGDSLGAIEECLSSGVLRAEDRAVESRHELARMAVEESIDPHRRSSLHRAALAALREPADGHPDLARLAHHAEAAGDMDAVLELAPAAGDRAAAVGAHREAAAQHARALRFGHLLPTEERADLLERRSRECYLTDQNDAAVAAIKQAVECRRELGQKLREGDSLRSLSQILWCPGRTQESARALRESVALLESQPPGRELALAYALLGGEYGSAGRGAEGRAHGQARSRARRGCRRR
jgi:predicted ATPase